MLPSYSATVYGGHRRRGLRTTASLPFYSTTSSSEALPSCVVSTRSARNPATRLARVGAPFSQPARTPFHHLRVIVKTTTTSLSPNPKRCARRPRVQDTQLKPAPKVVVIISAWLPAGLPTTRSSRFQETLRSNGLRHFQPIVKPYSQHVPYRLRPRVLRSPCRTSGNLIRCG
jgi:hypothetical protein